jgi:CheY-like chemotaxis protein
MKIFILEDDMSRMALFWEVLEGQNISHADNVEDAKRLYKEQAPFDVILLDHDLGGEQMVGSEMQNTGAAFCRWLTVPEAKEVTLIHSYNPQGAAEMYRILTLDKGWQQVACLPFGTRILAYLKGLVQGDQADGPETASD